MSYNKLYYESGALYAEIQKTERKYFYENGQLKTLEPCQDGQLHGEVCLYWPNGKPKRCSQFSRGMRHGFDRMWSEKGSLVDEGTYEEGRAVGVHRRFTEEGKLIEEVDYLDSTRFNCKVWDETGELHFEGIWTDSEYFEKSWDQFQKIWKEKKGRWDGKKVIYL